MERIFRKIPLVVAALIASFPITVVAQIVVSELMYDADGSDADMEYVELFNAGSSSVDLTKWKINDGSNHVLNVPPKNGSTGSTTMKPGDYLLLVDNATNFIKLHPGITSSIIDTVLGLPNGSGTVSIIDEGGATVDNFSYAKETSGAGDGNSLHRAGVGTAMFSPGAQTPGFGNLVAQSPPSNDNSNTVTSGTASQSETTSTAGPQNLGPPVSSASNFPVEPQIFAYAGKDREVITGADSIFEASAFNKKNEPITPGRFLWTFGDGTSIEGQTVMHHFSEPGRYAVVLEIADGLFAAAHQIMVTAIPVSIGLTLRDGKIILANKSDKNLNLSYWILRSIGKFFTLPKNTIILAGASVPFTTEVTHLSATGDTVLLYPNGVVATEANATVAANPISELRKASPETTRKNNVEQEPTTTFSRSPDQINTDTATTSSTAQVASTAGAVSDSHYLWWLGALGIALVGGGVVAAARRTGRREWNIIEEKS